MYSTVTRKVNSHNDCTLLPSKLKNCITTFLISLVTQKKKKTTPRYRQSDNPSVYACASKLGNKTYSAKQSNMNQFHSTNPEEQSGLEANDYSCGCHNARPHGWKLPLRPSPRMSPVTVELIRVLRDRGSGERWYFVSDPELELLTSVPTC